MLRGRLPPSRRPPEEISDDSPDAPPARLVTSIYPVRSYSPSEWPAKGNREKLLGFMMDRSFHSVESFEKLLPGGGWALAMEELLSSGYAFDRVGSYFRIKNRERNQARQSIADLLDGIDPSSRIRQVSETPREEEKETDFDPTTDSGTEDEETVFKGEEIGMLVLSDPPEDLALPALATATATGAILAKKRSGKTYLAMVLAEEMMALDPPVPLVIIDPLGQWYGLLTMADGTPSSYRITIMGGHHADVPIMPGDGKKAASAVNAIRPGHAILDLSDMSPSDQHRFIADFVEEFHATAPRSPVLVIVDEADEFAPQRLAAVNPHQKRSLDAMDRLVRRGRAKGIGTLLITQRSAVISKNVLSQVEGLWILSMVEPNDLAAVSGWLHRRVSPERREECLERIPKLLPGSAYFLQGGDRPMFRLFKVRRKRTFDSSNTPTGTPSRIARPRFGSEDVAVVKTFFSTESTAKPDRRRGT